MKNLKSQLYAIMSVTLLSLFLLSCSDGGGGNKNPTDNSTIDPNAAKWGSMFWGTDNWN